MKLLSPYITYEPDLEIDRFHNWVAICYRTQLIDIIPTSHTVARLQRKSYWGNGGTIGLGSDLDAAKAKFDEYLSSLGYTLLTTEQYEKIGILL